MTTTTLERVELPVEDFAPPCDTPPEHCSGDPAVYAVRLFCGCIRLSCQRCLDWLVEEIRKEPGGYVWECLFCGAETERKVWSVSDYVISITPI